MSDILGKWMRGGWLLIGWLSFSGCGGDPPTVRGHVDLSEPYCIVRTEQAEEATAFLTMVNHSHELERLITVQSPVAAEILMVQTSRDPDGSRAVPLSAGFQIGAGATLELAPNRSHFVLRGLRRGLKPGDAFTLDLHFKNAGALSLIVPVRSAEDFVSAR